MTADGKNHTMGKNDSMSMGHDGMRGTMKPDIDVGDLAPDMTPPSGRGEMPAGPPGMSGERPHGEYMKNDSDSDKDMMGKMSIDKFANHILALHLTCHRPYDFFGFNLVKILEYIMKKDAMHDGNRGNMTHRPTEMPEGPGPEGPDGSRPDRPFEPGTTEGPYDSPCDMIPG